MRIFKYQVVFVFALVNLLAPEMLAQETDSSQGQLTKVFVDCRSCDMNLIRHDMQYINHVRDQEVAEVHVFIVRSTSGSGGRIYDISFTGKKDFEGITNKLQYTSDATLTHIEIHQGLVRTIEMGLISYLAQTDIASAINISFDDIDLSARQTPNPDTWKN